MSLHDGWLPLALAALLAGCGGTVARNEGGAVGGSSSAGGSSSQAGASVSGGVSSGGAGVGTGATLSVGGGPDCASVDCASVDCAEGYITVFEPGACCPTCRPTARGCDDVKCQPVQDCGDGYELAQPPGACCVGCVPKPGVACVEIACPQTSCPAGYVRGDLVGGCCYDCVPDPLYCRGSEDCVMADKPRACCGCPEAITRRQYEAEPCWSEVGAPRPLPQRCYPQVTCDAVCGPCESVGDSPACAENRCVLRGFGLK